MTARDGQFFLGRRALYSVNSLQIEVEIVDVKSVYGSTRFQIKPVAGAGRVWVDSGSVLVDTTLPGGVRKLNAELEV